ncbi:beta-L-arabinofuranosidase domain-containing protein [Antarcticibacterium sp. 1MA-6-2]|uniref:beta-L-arabinofuranosidase domain-containing protein n=1 Tax=Antarcticibacterium sp. 1MA-6-2 TaxID=2908210 RepID=UPI002106762C|nr:beta-L-arabinofuranosidase domain-containing protein [Antarcticibacterium sp. 1MA-6-2]
MKTLLSCLFLSLVIFMISCQTEKSQVLNIQNVIIPDTSSTNSNYLSNRSPLTSSVLIKLPVGAVTPENWLKVALERQANGLMGNLGEISAWLQEEDNAWLSEDGTGSWGWEEVPYWLKGYGNTAYILKDEEMIAETKKWIEAALSSQRPDGNFGPKMIGKDGTQDFWSNMIMLYCLQSYYEYSGDEWVINFMSRYFKYQLQVPDEEFLSKSHYWQRIRGGDNLHSVFWLYNRTGEEWLLNLAEKIHRNTAPWSKRDNTLEEIGNWKETREGTDWPSWYSNLVDWHNVNVAQGFRELSTILPVKP